MAVKPRYVFRANWLYIAGTKRTTRIQAWPTLRAQRRRNTSKRWYATEPEFQLVTPAPAETPAQFSAPHSTQLLLTPIMKTKEECTGLAALAAFQQAIPPHVVKCVERFGPAQWHLLVLLSRCKEAVDLAISVSFSAPARQRHHRSDNDPRRTDRGGAGAT